MSVGKKLTGILGLLTLVVGLQGCAAFRPLKGIPARYLPDEYKAVSREHQRTIDPSLLGQRQGNQHLVGKGDVLGIYIEGVLGIPNQAPPVNFPIQPDAAPTIGFPLQVRDDGTISLPLLGAVDVRGMTIRQVEEYLRKTLTDRKILQPTKDKIIVTLQKARQIRIVVMRQESPNIQSGLGATAGSINLGEIKRGTGRVVSLPAGENDVLHALARSGGLPGLDAENAIYVIRRAKAPIVTPSSTMNPYMAPAIPTSPVPLSTEPILNSNMPMTMTPQSSSNIVQVGSWRYGNGNSNTVQNAGNFQAGYTQQPVQKQNIQRTGSYRSGGLPNSFGAPIPTNPVAYNQPSIPKAVAPVEFPQFNNSKPFQDSKPSSRYAPATNNLKTVTPMKPVMPNPVPKNNFSSVPKAPTVVPGGSYRSGGLPNSFAPVNQTPTPIPSAMPAQNFNQVPMMNSQPVHNNYQSFTPNPQPVMNQPIMNQPIPENLPEGFPVFEQGSKITRIPVRLKPGESINFLPEDVILNDGDVVFIESRDTEIYYTGGLLGGGQYTLPRDYDLDVLAAISIATSPQQNVSQVGRNVGGVSAVNGDVTISASDVIILRQLADGTQVTIKVDLYKALRHPEERIIIRPRDVIILQYKKGEAVGAFFERHLLEGALFGIAAAQLQSNGN